MNNDHNGETSKSKTVLYVAVIVIVSLVYFMYIRGWWPFENQPDRQMEPIIPEQVDA